MKSRRYALTAALAIGVSALMCANAAALPVTFTGNTAADFALPGTMVFADNIGGTGDVGLSGGGMSNPGQPSGFDFVQVYLYYDVAGDTLYIGFDTYGIAGDSNGDGNPFDEGTGTGRIDMSEAIILGVDMDGDGDHTTDTYEVLIGIDIFAIDAGEAGLESPGVGFPTILSTNINPATTSAVISQMVIGNDFEIAVSGFAEHILGVTPSADIEFSFNAFSDAGAGGEDILGAYTYKIPEPGTIIMIGSALAIAVGFLRGRLTRKD